MRRAFRNLNRKNLILFLVFCILTITAVSSFGLANYNLTVTTGQRDSIHQRIEGLKDQLFAAMGRQIEIDSISYGGALEDTSWPFAVRNVAGTTGSGLQAGNRLERDRKISMFKEAVDTAKALGFPVVVQRQNDKIIYAEFGDPDAPEMVMALSHLDSPTSSITSPNLGHWMNETGTPDPEAYHKFITRTIGGVEWMYGAGIQDDSGPTVATLLAAKALMDAGFPIDRRIRIAMGGYEDFSPTRPTAAQTRTFVNIPYYPANNPGFFDNWAYKYLFREEIPIACFTSDSRFPVIIGNSGVANRTATMSLAADSGLKFELVSGDRGITDRAGDDTLQYIGDGSGVFLPSKASFALRANGATQVEVDTLLGALQAAQTSDMGGGGGTVTLGTATLSGYSCITITINTNVAMEAPTPQYGKNAVVWGMYLIDKANREGAFPDTSLKLLTAAKDITAAFMKDGVENYQGEYIGINPIRRADNGCPYMTISYGQNVGKTSVPSAQTFFSASTGILTTDLYIRSMYDVNTDYTAAQDKVTAAFPAGNGWALGNAPSFPSPTLYLKHDNPLTELQFASYRNTISASGFEDVAALLPVSYPQGTTGGTLASDYWNKMNAYGAVLPGNERWWHGANERMSKKSAVQMTKAFADCLLEMARYSGPAGAQFLSADITGFNSDRADLDLLDVTIGTFKDARAVLGQSSFGGKRLAAATAFDIEMFSAPFTGGQTQAAINLGHAPNGIYVPLDNADYVSKTFVAPMRLEFKLKKDDLGISNSNWQSIKGMSIEKTLSYFEFNIRKADGTIVSLNNLAPSNNLGKYFSRRISKYDPNTLYLTVHLAIADRAGDAISVTPIVASRSDRYEPVDPINYNPWSSRLETTQRGFFLVDDGAKDGKFTSPSAIFVTTSLPRVIDAGDTGTTPSSPQAPTDTVAPTPTTVTPASDGTINAPVTIPDKNDTQKVSGLALDQGNDVVQALNDIGLTVAIDPANPNSLIVSGTATDIGTFEIPVTVTYSDGSTGEVLVVFTISAIENTTNNVIDRDNMKNTWDTTLTGTHGNSIVTFVISINLSASDALNGKDVTLSASGLNISDAHLEVAGGLQSTNTRGAGSVTLHATGTTSDFNAVKINSFSYRLGINRYTQALNITPANDTAVSDNRTDASSSSGSSGCNAGALAVLTPLALLCLTKRRKA